MLRSVRRWTVTWISPIHYLHKLYECYLIYVRNVLLCSAFMLVCTVVSKLQEIPQNSSRQMGDVKQFPFLGPIYMSRSSTKF